MKIIPFRRSWIPYRFLNATYYLMGANLLVFFIGIISPKVFYLLSLSAGGLEQGFFWQTISYSFVEYLNNLWTLVFNLLALYFFGIQVEHELGSYEFLALYFGLSIVNALLAFALFRVLGIDFYLNGSTGLVSAVMLVWASFNPHEPIYFFGIIPIRAPVLMAIVVGILVLSLLISGPVALVHLFAIALAYLYMLVRHRKNVFSTLFRRY